MLLNEQEIKINKLRDQFLSDHPDWLVFAVKHDPALHRYINKVIPLSEITQDDLYADKLKEELQHYPGLKALAAHFEAHRLFAQDETRAEGRALAEAAKTLTGIEIHPEATVDPYTFIDHGNGVVIGAQSRLGTDVQMFKGVTLGSFGKVKEGERRHPTIGNHVILSDGAKLLGRCVVGDHVVIGPDSHIINAKIGVGSIIGPDVHWQNKDIPDHVRVTAKGDLVVLSPLKADAESKEATKWFAQPVDQGFSHVRELYDSVVNPAKQQSVA